MLHSVQVQNLACPDGADEDYELGAVHQGEKEQGICHDLAGKVGAEQSKVEEAACLR